MTVKTPKTKVDQREVLVDQRQALLDIQRTLSSALGLLVQASRETSDQEMLIRISLEYNQIKSVFDQVLNAQALTDDAVFTKATAAIRDQAQELKNVEEHINKIVADVGMAAKIAGYIAEAATGIAKL